MSEFLLLLYLIEILHQTTTSGLHCLFHNRLYLIEILHQTTTNRVINILAAGLYLIEILHQTTTAELLILIPLCCILSKFYIKPQQTFCNRRKLLSCILSKFYIKPQHRAARLKRETVVSYRNSTSNHNPFRATRTLRRLYLIEILHQTTTAKLEKKIEEALYLIEILHQTTTGHSQCFRCCCCILSKFYIKPQR